MQVFMPYSDLKRSAQCLDPKRLGNQIYNEAFVLSQGKWPNHPCAKIWRGHYHALAQYCLYGLEELFRRGRSYPRWDHYWTGVLADSPDTGLPPIIGIERFHSGHRAALLAKAPEWYSRYGWTETPQPDTKLAYIWKEIDRRRKENAK